MKRYIHANTNILDRTTILSLLSDAGIDLTDGQYALEYDDGDRYEGEDIIKKTFSCNGDWLACLSILFCKDPMIMLPQYWDYSGFAEFIDEHPTVEDVIDWAAGNENRCKKLVNLSTNRLLFEDDSMFW